MKIATIIPTKNEEANLPALLDSLQTHPGDEVVVVDAASEDATVEIARARGLRVILESGGVVAQLNRAAAEVEGDSFFFLHADCRVGFDAAAAIREALADTRCVGGGFRLDYGPGFVPRLLAGTANLRGRMLGLPMGDQGLFLRRAVFESVGGFRSGPLLPDLELMSRARREGRIALRPERLYTSPRRYADNGLLRNLLANQVLLWAHLASPERAPEWAVRWLRELRRRELPAPNPEPEARRTI